jgi:hypothetical protein
LQYDIHILINNQNSGLSITDIEFGIKLPQWICQNNITYVPVVEGSRCTGTRNQGLSTAREEHIWRAPITFPHTQPFSRPVNTSIRPIRKAYQGSMASSDFSRRLASTRNTGNSLWWYKFQPSFLQWYQGGWFATIVDHTVATHKGLALRTYNIITID